MSLLRIPIAEISNVSVHLWLQVGKKNKTAVTRQSGMGAGAEGRPRSAIDAIFSGATRSVIKTQSAKVGYKAQYLWLE